MAIEEADLDSVAAFGILVCNPSVPSYRVGIC